MIHKVLFSLTGIKQIEYYFGKHEETIATYFEENPDKNLLWWADQGNRYLKIRGSINTYKMEVLPIKNNDQQAVIEYDDFTPGRKPNDLPEWYPYIKDFIIETSAKENYGLGQGIKVNENLTFNTASAIIRHQKVDWGRDGALAYIVKIHADGPDSLPDSLALHARILSGEAYECQK